MLSLIKLNHYSIQKVKIAITEEKNKWVTDLYYNQGKTTREIAEIERISIRDISAILKEEELKQQK